MRVFMVVVLVLALAFAGLAHASDGSSAPIAPARPGDPRVRVIEVSVIPGVYESGHIPGAVNFVWHTDLVKPVSPGRRLVRTALRSSSGAPGSTTIPTVVFYGDNNNWFAAWGAWIFNLYGVKDVRILDGGRAKWEAEGRELSIRPRTYALPETSR